MDAKATDMDAFAKSGQAAARGATSDTAPIRGGVPKNACGLPRVGGGWVVVRGDQGRHRCQLRVGSGVDEVARRSGSRAADRPMVAGEAVPSAYPPAPGGGFKV